MRLFVVPILMVFMALPALAVGPRWEHHGASAIVKPINADWTLGTYTVFFVVEANCAPMSSVIALKGHISEYPGLFTKTLPVSMHTLQGNSTKEKWPVVRVPLKNLMPTGNPKLDNTEISMVVIKLTNQGVSFLKGAMGTMTINVDGHNFMYGFSGSSAALHKAKATCVSWRNG